MAQDRHGQLGQVLERQYVNLAVASEQIRSIEVVAPEAGAIADANRCRISAGGFGYHCSQPRSDGRIDHCRMLARNQRSRNLRLRIYLLALAHSAHDLPAANAAASSLWRLVRSSLDMVLIVARWQGPPRLPLAPLAVLSPGVHAGRRPEWARKKMAENGRRSPVGARLGGLQRLCTVKWAIPSPVQAHQLASAHEFSQRDVILVSCSCPG